MNWTDAAQQTVDAGVEVSAGIAEHLAVLSPAQVRQLSGVAGRHG